MRVLAAIRLSRLTDASTSPARQAESIALWARMHDAVVVATATDLDVSGSVSPFKRPALGPYLTERLDSLEYGSWSRPDDARAAGLHATAEAMRGLDPLSADYAALYAPLAARLVMLQEEPADAQEPVWVPSGRLVGDVRDSGADGSAALLRSMGLLVVTWRDTEVRARLDVEPLHLVARLGARAIPGLVALHKTGILDKQD